MGGLAAGQVVFLPFPFSDLSEAKRRPVLVVASAGLGDWLVCQITSNPSIDLHALELTQASFAAGGLQRTSYLRPAKLYAADGRLATRTAGLLTVEAFGLAQQAICKVIDGRTHYLLTQSSDSAPLQ